MRNLIIYCTCFIAFIHTFDCKSARLVRSVTSEWHGKWFPQDPGSPDDNDVLEYDTSNRNNPDVDTNHHSTAMGIVNDMCDNAKVNLTLDWNNSPINYICFEQKSDFLPNLDVHPILHCDHIPVKYQAQHICMDTSIEYKDLIPTFGPHRPLWAKYGEYTFLPKQRWLHNLEHGAVVMLYHPCANKNEVLLLKRLVRSCLYRHIITPYNLLPPDRPLALLTWGCRFLMSKVDVKLVTEYIRHAALDGPEFLSKNGQFDYGLLQDAEILSDIEDSELCPNLV